MKLENRLNSLGTRPLDDRASGSASPTFAVGPTGPKQPQSPPALGQPQSWQQQPLQQQAASPVGVQQRLPPEQVPVSEHGEVIVLYLNRDPDVRTLAAAAAVPCARRASA